MTKNKWVGGSELVVLLCSESLWIWVSVGSLLVPTWKPKVILEVQVWVYR